jgi:hypothetical protein
VVLCDPPPALAALSGLSAVCYLLLRYASGSVAPVTRPIVVGALGFSMIGWSAAAIPAEFTRLPVVAPLALVALYVLVTRPFVPHLRSGGRGGGGLTRS